jgi:peptidoglycan-associated lipoprotein
MRVIIRTFGLLGVIAVLSACSTTQPPVEATTPVTSNTEVKSVNVAPQSVAYDPIKDPKSPVYNKKSIYFDFDQYTISSKDTEFLQAHASYLNVNKAKKVNIVIQGNTDERGTTEYNLALGQKRSESVRKALTLLGVESSQMEAVSFGKEKPAKEAHNEESWKENRRADIVYK